MRHLLPQPVWKGHTSTVDCYWKTCDLALSNLRQPTAKNGFVSNYIDTAFNGCLFMWDSVFILLFARYGLRVFEFQRTLDNLYAKQHPDGFICREISEDDGTDRFERFDPVSTGPNIMPWAEWEYYLNVNDRSRLSAVFPVLLGYYQWLRSYRTWRDGTYWTSGWACGMDNQPRLQAQYHIEYSHGHQIWLDACLQQIFSARLLCKMADVLGRQSDVAPLSQEIDRLSRLVNRRLWHDESAFYFDSWTNGRFNEVKSIGAYWALLADVIPEENLDRFVAHLDDPATFNRPHRVPSLAANHPDYQSDGGYWLGGVWSPTTYMVLRGLSLVGYETLAHQIAMNHLENVVTVFERTGTLWENYAPEKANPGSPAKPNFVGWTGLSTVAILFEYVFGLRADGPSNRLVWDVRVLDECGISRYPFGRDGLLNLHCASRTSFEEKPIITVEANVPLTLELRWSGKVEEIEF